MEKAAKVADILDLIVGTEGTDFDVKAIGTIFNLRKMDAQERGEAEATLDVDLNALGMISELFEVGLPS